MRRVARARAGGAAGTPSPADVTATTAAAAAAAATPAVEAATAARSAGAQPRSRASHRCVRSASSVDMSKEYLIGPEDVLDITVWKNCPDLSRTVPVRPDGKVSLPLVNDIQAAGLTPMELRRAPHRAAVRVPAVAGSLGHRARSAQRQGGGGRRR